jgi:sugar-specific transcriptional regulator TrmB
VYIQLLEKGSCSARQLADRVAIPRTSVYDHLKLLIQKGLVVERFDEGRSIFGVDAPENLPKLIDEEIESLKNNRQKIVDLLPTLFKNTSTVEPKIRFYSGVEGLRHVLNDFKWQHNEKTMAVWPIQEMISLLGKDFFDDLNRRRIKQNVYVRGIWPKGKGADAKTHPYMGTGPEFLRELRTAPRHIKWDMGYWIYGDKVAFISSRKEAYGFTIHSKDFSNLMRMQFEILWKQSHEIKPDRKYTDTWIKDVYRELGKNPSYKSQSIY